MQLRNAIIEKLEGKCQNYWLRMRFGHLEMSVAQTCVNSLTRQPCCLEVLEFSLAQEMIPFPQDLLS